MELVLLIAATVVAVLVGSTVSTLNRVHGRIRSVTALGRPDIDHYELAYLAGGPRRVINTAIALLSAQDRIRVSRGGRITIVAGAPTSSRDAVEQAVLDQASSPGGRTAGEIRHEVAGGVAMTGLKHRLIGRGLLLPDGSLTEPRRIHARLRGLTLLAFGVEVLSLVVALTGLVPWNVPTLLAVIFAGVSGVRGLLVYRRHTRSLRGLLTRAGFDALQTARIRQPHAAYEPGDAAAYAAMAGAVALYGLGQFGDQAVAAEIGREEIVHHGAGGAGATCAAGTCGGGVPDGGSASGSDGGSASWGDSGGGGGDFGGGGDSGGSSCGGSSCGSSGCGSGCGGGGCGGG
ncbi:TIGR04222 domain-containing membrane protein [Planotetraspora sp. GP83]|uniref:TIGR04222 domain-containing membrane protein n=1 Tax=Planotetraspora sp. GP83 TaxID=3156264 RepID=UPI003511713F